MSLPLQKNEINNQLKISGKKIDTVEANVLNKEKLYKLNLKKESMIVRFTETIKSYNRIEEETKVLENKLVN